MENQDCINQYVEDALSFIRTGTDLSIVKDSKVIFEAVLEKKDLKVDLLKKVDNLCGKDTLYLTNTSSIPINILNKEANLRWKDNRVSFLQSSHGAETGRTNLCRFYYSGIERFLPGAGEKIEQEDRALQ